MRSSAILIPLALTLLSLFACKPEKAGDEIPPEEQGGYMLPRVLILTTGTGSGNGVMPEGIVVAAQTFNSAGAFVTMRSRDILLDSVALRNFNIMIVSTAAGYHDADRKYSLTFMSDEELRTLTNWVKNGGVLIAGDNIGRNLPDATDRTSLYGELTPGIWAIGECFGLSLVEKNIRGYRLDGSVTAGLEGNFIPEFKDDVWALVIDTVYSDSLKVLAKWVGPGEEIPAMVQNRYGKGLGILLPTSYLLHPVNSGGYWGAEQIREFYLYVLRMFNTVHACSLRLNIWPEARDYAFCATLNSAGSLDEYRRVFALFEQENIAPTVFVNSLVDTGIMNFLQNVPLQSNGYLKVDAQNAQFYEINRNILLNEKYWNRNFTGFRFPFTRPAYWGFECLSRYGYRFDSSIGLDNLESFYGCAFPYNIIISGNTLYEDTEMLEISPVLHDDYFFYERLLAENYSETDIIKDSRLYRAYLMNFWELAVKPYNGLMVYLGHPMYCGHNDSTLLPLQQLITEVKSDNTWITTIESVAEYWNDLSKVKLYVTENENSADVYVSVPDSTRIKDLTLKTERKVSSAKAAEGKCKILEKDGHTAIMFDAYNKQHVVVNYSEK